MEIQLRSNKVSIQHLANVTLFSEVVKRSFCTLFCLLTAASSLPIMAWSEDKAKSTEQETRLIIDRTDCPQKDETNDHLSQSLLRNVEFDIEFAEKYVDYSISTDDVLITTVFDERNYDTRILSLLNDGEVNEAIASLEQKISEYLSVRSPWGTLLPNVESNQSFTHLPDEDFPLSKYIQLLGLAFELKGNYKEARRAYRLVFDANPRDRSWTSVRLRYEVLDHNDEGYDINAESIFAIVCSIIQNEYDLSYEKVLETIDYVKMEEDKWKTDPPRHSDTPVFLLFPDENRSAWFNARELYRIRIWCARFVCPNLLYKHRIRDNKFTREGRVESIQLIRDSYDAFMTFMEEIYAKAMEDGNERVASTELKYRSKEQKDRFTATMAILRKIKELPY